MDMSVFHPRRLDSTYEGLKRRPAPATGAPPDGLDSTYEGLKPAEPHRPFENVNLLFGQYL